MYMEQRETAPKSGNPFWTSAAKGGKSPCYVISKSTGDTLPNCVGYAWGRCYEAWGIYPPWLPVNAENIMSNRGGLETGMTPKLGSVMLWRKGRTGDSADGMGHIEFVETIYQNGDVLTSASNYGGARFYRSRRTKSGGYSLGAAYVFQGFVYAPMELAESLGTPVKRDPVRDQVLIKTNILNVRTAPSINADRLGYLTPGLYNVLDTGRAGDWTWAMVEDGLWVALGDKWCEYYAGYTEPLFTLTMRNLNIGDLNYFVDIAEEDKIEYEVEAS